MMPSDALAHHTYRSRSLKPASPALNASSAFALSCFTAATAFSSIALASSGVPKSAAAHEAAVQRTIRLTAPPTANARLRNISDLLRGGMDAADKQHDCRQEHSVNFVEQIDRLRVASDFPPASQAHFEPSFLLSPCSIKPR